MVAPSATPKAVVEQISAEVGRILRLPEVVKSFSDQGVIAAPNSPADFNKFIAAEIQRLGAVVKSANIQVD